MYNHQPHAKALSNKWLTPSSVVSLLNGGGGALLNSGDDDALLDVITDYFTDDTPGENLVYSV